MIQLCSLNGLVRTPRFVSLRPFRSFVIPPFACNFRNCFVLSSFASFVFVRFVHLLLSSFRLRSFFRSFFSSLVKPTRGHPMPTRGTFCHSEDPVPTRGVGCPFETHEGPGCHEGCRLSFRKPTRGLAPMKGPVVVSKML